VARFQSRSLIVRLRCGNAGFTNSEGAYGARPVKAIVVMCWSEGNEAATSRRDAWKWDQYRDRQQRWIV
jgi:hypothetical protein